VYIFLLVEIISKPWYTLMLFRFIISSIWSHLKNSCFFWRLFWLWSAYFSSGLPSAGVYAHEPMKTKKSLLTMIVPHSVPLTRSIWVSKLFTTGSVLAVFLMILAIFCF